ncbi:MAG: LbtU family siderophore porin [Candidatus Thiodiazotropha sp. (ex Monitilora ramsayi)]|nr:LbtU family siderophore porin [Candidatus Thiodiazotropha sp. (ex Monitilora ramsayi)]
MQKKYLFSAVLAALPGQHLLSAEPSIGERLESTEQRIQYLENRIRDQDTVINDNRSSNGWFEHAHIGGVVEVEAGFQNPEDGDSESSLTLATAELAIALEITPVVSSEIVLLYEDDGEEALDVDIATITLAPTESWFINAGQFYVPFGIFDTQMISDPLTLELGETRETAVQFGMVAGSVSGSIYLFDGDASENNTSSIDNFGAHLDFALEGNNHSFTAGLGYINDLGDSDTLIDYAGDVHNRVGGFTFIAGLHSGPFIVIGEYLGANDEFETGEKPAAYNLEAGYSFSLAGRDTNVAIGIQGTDDAEGIGLPEEILITALSLQLFDSTRLGFEYANTEDYDGTNSDMVTVQLASEF